MRTALLLSRAAALFDVDRSGRTGQFVEVYPASALARWGVKTKYPRKEGGSPISYKDPRGIDSAEIREKRGALRRRMVRRLVERLEASHEVVTRLATSDHTVDALASALVALMVAIDPERDKGFIEPIPEGVDAIAKREGWIALPKTCSLTHLRHWLSERSRPARRAR